MSSTQFSARTARSEGTLQLTDTAITFIPEYAVDGAQLGFSWDGFELAWDVVTDVERVLLRRGTRAAGTAGGGGPIRIHYADAARFVTVTVTEDLNRFFAAFDEQLALARAA